MWGAPATQSDPALPPLQVPPPPPPAAGAAVGPLAPAADVNCCAGLAKACTLATVAAAGGLGLLRAGSSPAPMLVAGRGRLTTKGTCCCCRPGPGSSCWSLRCCCCCCSMPSNSGAASAGPAAWCATSLAAAAAAGAATAFAEATLLLCAAALDCCCNMRCLVVPALPAAAESAAS